MKHPNSAHRILEQFDHDTVTQTQLRSALRLAVTALQSVADLHESGCAKYVRRAESLVVDALVKLEVML